MAKLEYRKMSDDEVRQELTALDGWTVRDGEIFKKFHFDYYKDGVEFARTVAHVADEMNHHPTILVEYSDVTISMNTHDVQGLSPYDFALARKIEML